MKSLCSGSSVLNPVIVFTLICIKEREKWKGKKKSCCILFCSFFSCSGSEVLTFCFLNGYELSCLPWCCNFAPNGSWIHNPQFTLNLQGEELPIELELIGIFFFLFKTIKYAYLCYRDLKLCKLEPTAVHQECTENGPRTTVVSGPTDGRADKCVFWKMIMYVLSIIILIRNWYVAYLFDFWLIQYMGILIVCLSQICFRWFCNCRMNERNEFDNFLDECSSL